MNRDIEFRVWDDHYKYMNYKVIVGIYGNWEEVKDNENYTACSMWIEPKNVDYKCEPHWAHFEPYHKEIKLMQYTGLKDKNGKKIFEGDIVKYRSGGYGVDKKGKIIYKTKKYIIDYDIKMLMFYLKAKNEKDNEIIDITDEKEWIEVIGNIYENKELLEV